ncbi:MAG: hypothetical protein HYY93_01480 [Planctomycetes bacterium]|nr:hypothetical protein [Planctomycetota bacterium]
MYRLTVNDGTLSSVPDAVQVLVSTATVVAPSADPGIGQVVTLGSPAPTITLDGHESVDPDSQTALSFTWTQLSGPAITAMNPLGFNAQSVSFQPTTTGICLFQLVVQDALDDGLSSLPRSVTVIVLGSNTPPRAVAAVSGFTDTNSNGLLEGVRR